MNATPQPDLRAAVVAMCAQLGADALLVQGAGGNVSWKDGDTLWIKASGTWLADAATDAIFVPVDLAGLRRALADGDYDTRPAVLGTATLRPSIETVLHALMPQPVVVHVHAIDVLAHLVRQDCAAGFSRLLDPSLAWTMVPYRKPGADLARAVAEALQQHPADIVFLQNHGVVIGAADTAGVMARLAQLTQALATGPAFAAATPATPAPVLDAHGVRYDAVADAALHQLARVPALFARLGSEWALYPDHVVFLGAHACTYPDAAALAAAIAGGETPPAVAFIEGEGVYTTGAFGVAKEAQLRCYFDVMVRQAGQGPLHALALQDVGDLLNWDAERYRQNLSKK
jgi:rhamnose utilization protein RhaD (predicted bifunctional aldolase and dehydrogenase)